MSLSPGIAEGVTTGPGQPTPTEETLRELERIREQTAASHHREDSSDVIAFKRGILDAGSETEVRSGIVTEDDVQKANDWRKFEQLAAEGQPLLEQANIDRAELDMYRQQERLERIAQEFTGARADETSRRDLELWGYEMTDAERRVLVEEGVIDQPWIDWAHEEGLPWLAKTLHEENVSNYESNLIMGQAAVEADLLTQAGFTTPEAQAQVHKEVRELVRERRGFDVYSLTDAEEFHREYVAALTVRHELLRSEANAKFQQSVLDTVDTDISSGLTKVGDNGQEVPASIPHRVVEARPRFDRLARELDQPEHDTAYSIKAGIMAAHSPSETSEWSRVQKEAQRQRRESTLVNVDGTMMPLEAARKLGYSK
jgi:hypothetical protein